MTEEQVKPESKHKLIDRKAHELMAIMGYKRPVLPLQHWHNATGDIVLDAGDLFNEIVDIFDVVYRRGYEDATSRYDDE